METVVAELFKTLIGLGPGGVIAALMYYNWREERTERRALQEQNSNLLKTKIESDNALANAIENLAEKVTAK